MSRFATLSLLAPATLLGLVTIAVSGRASADENNAAVIACQGKSEGDACKFTRNIKSNEGQPEQRDSPGVCTADECCEQDYSKGSPPEVSCGPCLACIASGPRPTPHAPEVVSADGGAGSADAGGEPPRASSPPPADTPHDKRGCSVGDAGRAGGHPLAPLALLVLVGLGRRRATGS